MKVLIAAIPYFWFLLILVLLVAFYRKPVKHWPALPSMRKWVMCSKANRDQDHLRKRVFADGNASPQKDSKLPISDAASQSNEDSSEVQWTFEYYGMGGHFYERRIRLLDSNSFEFWSYYDNGTQLECTVNSAFLKEIGVEQEFRRLLLETSEVGDFSNSDWSKGVGISGQRTELWNRIVMMGKNQS